MKINPELLAKATDYKLADKLSVAYAVSFGFGSYEAMLTADNDGNVILNKVSNDKTKVLNFLKTYVY